MKKIEAPHYFLLADSMASPSAILELFASESPIFGFCTFWGPNSRNVTNWTLWEQQLCLTATLLKTYSLKEVHTAIGKLHNGLAAGLDDISPELLKCAKEPISIALHTLFAKV